MWNLMSVESAKILRVCPVYALDILGLDSAIKTRQEGKLRMGMASLQWEEGTSSQLLVCSVYLYIVRGPRHVCMWDDTRVVPLSIVIWRGRGTS